MTIPTLDAPRRLLFTVIYQMRGVTARELAASLGYDPQWTWRAVLGMERQGLVTVAGGIVKPAEWTVA